MLATFRGLLKSYLKPLPLDLDKYLFKKKINSGLFSIALKKNSFPVYIRENSTDIKVFNQIFYKNEYDLALYSEPKVILDCGANIGLTSVYFANKFPNATIIAIEPENANFQMLLKNTKSYKNIHCLNFGIWNKTTHLEVIDRGEGAWAFIVKEVDHETVNSIKAISIDEVIKMFSLERIDLLKMDIEGSEKEVFEQGSEKWLSKVTILVLELHDKVKKGCTQAMISALKDHEYSIEPFCESLVVRLNGALEVS